MKVLINDVEYVPAQPEKPVEDVFTALDIRFDSGAGENITIREYLRLLLETLWREGEGFSGKRPFGNSGWEYDLYKPLIEHGCVKGELDDEGYIKDIDKAAADQYVFDLIDAAFCCN